MQIVITYRHAGQSEYLEYIERAFSSAKLWGYNTVLVGDAPGVKNIDTTIELKGDKYLMDWILAAEKAYIDSKYFDQNSVIFSPDALISKRLDEVFGKDFDLAVTVRDSVKMPINNGVIYLKPDNKYSLSLLWGSICKRCSTYKHQKRVWYGDQLAIQEVLAENGDSPFGLKVLRLPCDTYNFSPVEGEWDVDEEVIRNSYVIHMKGDRKKFIESTWQKIQKYS